MGAEGFILTNPWIPRFLKCLTHSAPILRWAYAFNFVLYEIVTCARQFGWYWGETLKLGEQRKSLRERGLQGPTSYERTAGTPLPLCHTLTTMDASCTSPFQLEKIVIFSKCILILMESRMRFSRLWEMLCRAPGSTLQCSNPGSGWRLGRWTWITKQIVESAAGWMCQSMLIFSRHYWRK